MKIDLARFSPQGLSERHSSANSFHRLGEGQMMKGIKESCVTSNDIVRKLKDPKRESYHLHLLSTFARSVIFSLWLFFLLDPKLFPFFSNAGTINTT